MNPAQNNTFPLEIRFSFDIPLFDTTPSFLTEFTGTIILAEDGVGEIEAGTITVTRVEIEDVYHHGHSICSMIDEDSQLYGLYKAIFTTYGAYKKRIIDIVGNRINRRFLLINRIEILPELRGSKFGLLAIHHTIAHIGKGCGLIAIKPFPLRFDSDNEEKKCHVKAVINKGLEINQKRAIRKLKTHYAQLGFHDTKLDNYMVRSSVTRNERPKCLEAYL